MAHSLINKIGHFKILNETEKKVIQDSIYKVARLEKRENIISEDEKANCVALLIDGWACRYKLLPDGKHHIMAHLIPGDLSDVNAPLLERMDHSIRTLTPARVGYIHYDTIRQITQQYPNIADALAWATLVDEAILREWLVNVGSRSATQRLAHLICELLVRSHAAGNADGTSFLLPLTQEELGDTMGLTVVHTNRSLKQMRHDGLINIERKVVTINNWERATAFAQFDPTYLHMPIPESWFEHAAKNDEDGATPPPPLTAE